MSGRICSIDGCEKRHKSRGFCGMHYYRLRMHGTTADPRGTYRDRLLRHIEKGSSDECWRWLGYIDRGGYGIAKLPDRTRTSAHRVVYMELIGAIPDGLHLDHLCRNRACVNPDHLEPVTPRENSRRGEPAQRTHCPQRHPYSEENTRWRGNNRKCRACEREQDRARRSRRAAA